MTGFLSLMAPLSCLSLPYISKLSSAGGLNACCICSVVNISTKQVSDWKLHIEAVVAQLVKAVGL